MMLNFLKNWIANTAWALVFIFVIGCFIWFVGFIGTNFGILGILLLFAVLVSFVATLTE